MSKIHMDPINAFIRFAEHTNDESLKKILSEYAKNDIDDFITVFITYLKDNDYTFESTDARHTYDMVRVISLPDLRTALFQFIWGYCKNKEAEK